METVLVKALSFILIILCAYALKRAGIFCKEDNRMVVTPGISPWYLPRFWVSGSMLS